MAKDKNRSGEVKTFKLNLIPLGDKVIVREIKVEAGGETKSGIIIPTTVNPDRGAKKGEILAVGEGKIEEGKLIPMHVKIGDTVLFQWGDEVKIDGEEYQVVSESNILAIIK